MPDRRPPQPGHEQRRWAWSAPRIHAASAVFYWIIIGAADAFIGRWYGAVIGIIGAVTWAAVMLVQPGPSAPITEPAGDGPYREAPVALARPSWLRRVLARLSCAFTGHDYDLCDPYWRCRDCGHVAVWWKATGPERKAPQEADIRDSYVRVYAAVKAAHFPSDSAARLKRVIAEEANIAEREVEDERRAAERARRA